ncbi:MAG: MBL fold metallo-hydrolase [Bacilli bacterium]|nr:MBL fold metallo-hydrolase [Bacilli bacterium]
MKKEIIIVIPILIFILIGFIYFSKKSNETDINDLEIYFFQAGKADAILISKNEKYMLIDTGESTLSTTILNYLKERNINRLEYLIITHFDKDHVGSASTIIDQIEIGEVLQSNVPKESEYYEKYLNSLKEKNITPTTITKEEIYTLSDLEIKVIGTNTIYEKNTSNNSSLIVEITNKNNKFLFMGDCENDRIKDFLTSNEETYDFIKIPYHGNYLKRLEELIDETSPTYGVMTCSKEEGCEEETIEVLNKNNIKYYMTKNGSIRIISNGDKITIKQ